jgi:hypothetical protein
VQHLQPLTCHTAPTIPAPGYSRLSAPVSSPDYAFPDSSEFNGT